jgi:hypothetical protein
MYYSISQDMIAVFPKYIWVDRVSYLQIRETSSAVQAESIFSQDQT